MKAPMNIFCACSLQDEFLSIMLPNHGKQLQRPEHSANLLHRPVTPKGALALSPPATGGSHTICCALVLCVPALKRLAIQFHCSLNFLVGAPAERIPAQVDWRGTGADGPVKVSQFQCLTVHANGSCRRMTDCCIFFKLTRIFGVQSLQGVTDPDRRGVARAGPVRLRLVLGVRRRRGSAERFLHGHRCRLARACALCGPAFRAHAPAVSSHLTS